MKHFLHCKFKSLEKGAREFKKLNSFHRFAVEWSRSARPIFNLNFCIMPKTTLLSNQDLAPQSLPMGPGFKKYDLSELMELFTYQEDPSSVATSLSYSRNLLLQLVELVNGKNLRIDLGGFADAMYDLENLERILERIDAFGVPMKEVEVR